MPAGAADPRSTADMALQQPRQMYDPPPATTSALSAWVKFSHTKWYQRRQRSHSAIAKSGFSGSSQEHHTGTCSGE